MSGCPALPEGVAAWHVDHIDADGVPIPGAIYVPDGYTFEEARELGLLGHVCDDACDDGQDGR